MGNKSSSRVVQGEPDNEIGAQMPNDQPAKDAELESMMVVANIASQIRAAIYQGTASCSVHEICDGRCGGLDAFFEPTIVRTSQGISVKRRPSTRPTDERATPFVIDDALEEFTYTTLDPLQREIRLLSVKSAIFRADNVECTLEVFSMDRAPEYAALSYCWGSGPSGKRILCNGNVFTARPSLEGALKRYRNAGSEGSPRSIKGTPEFLWVDAICIDQDNIPEKNNQLLLMQKIYRGAKVVFIDLGDVTPDWYCGYDLIIRTQELCDMPNLELALPNPDHLAWGAYWYIFMQPWFTREWVIQEITLAQAATVMFGRFIWTWEELEKSNSILSKGTALQSYLSRYGAAAQGIINFRKIVDIRRNYLVHHLSENSNAAKTVQHHGENTLFSDLMKGSFDSLKLIELTRDFLCFDPRDKVFALSALMDDVKTLALGDYSSTVTDVYTRFALHHIRRGHTFIILDHAGLHRRNLDVLMPSWVPDWTGQGSVRNSKRPIAGLRNVPFSASAGAPANVWVPDESPNNLQLVIKGEILDSLRVVAQKAAEADNEMDGKGFLAWHSMTRALFEGSQQLCSSIYQNLEDAFARLLLMDDLYTGHNKIEWERSINDPTASYKQAIERIISDGNMRSRDVGERDEVETFKTQMVVACNSRSFAISNHGYISLVPMSAKDEDVICIFHGATVPYILRRSLDGVGYHLVGDAYVHGAMHGEAVTENSIEVTLL